MDTSKRRSEICGEFSFVVLEEVTWTDRVRNEEVLHSGKEETNTVHTIRRRKANRIGHFMCRNFLLQNFIEGKMEGRIEVTGRRGRRRERLLDDLGGGGEVDNVN